MSREQALKNIDLINDAQRSLEDVDKKLDYIDFLVRHSFTHRLFVRKGRVIVAPLSNIHLRTCELELSAGDLLWLEIGLQKDKDKIQAHLDELLDGMGNNGGEENDRESQGRHHRL